MPRLLVLVALLLHFAPMQPAQPGDCGALSGTCGVTGEATHFHGVLAVTGASWVLSLSATSGSAGCGDCEWSIVPACVTQHQGQPDTLCDGATAAPTCDPGQVLYRLYLTTAAVTDRDEGVMCLGGPHQPVPVGEIGVDDVGRYLDNVTPPDLTLSSRPQHATLAGLTTYFSAARPHDLRPSPFGGPDVTELITIAPVQANWLWGDDAASGWQPVGGTVSHRYLTGGVAHGGLATRWHARYTITYQGRTFGPYDADRELVRRQAFRLPVHTSSPILVSH